MDKNLLDVFQRNYLRIVVGTRLTDTIQTLDFTKNIVQFRNLGL